MLFNDEERHKRWERIRLEREEKERLMKERKDEKKKEKERTKKHLLALKRRERKKLKTKKKNEKKKENERLKKLAEKEKLLNIPKKKKVGRPKKRGPKKRYYYYVPVSVRNKKRKIVNFDYKIVSCLNGKQNGYIGNFERLEDAYEKLNELKSESDKVIFPNTIRNDGKKFQNHEHVYLLLQRNRDGQLVNTKVRNEFGKLIEQTSNSEKYVIIDKVKYDVEETFWVFGYDPKNERKTISWIYDNIICSNIETKYDMKRVMKYKNKILIKDDSNNIDMILCKNGEDAVKFYNKVSSFNIERKNKQILMCGRMDDTMEKKKKAVSEITELTGWERKKIMMSSTKFSKK